MSGYKPTTRMLTMLAHIAAGRPWNTGLTGRSEHGGALKALHALKTRGYIDSTSNAKLTTLGERTLGKAGNLQDFKAHLRITELEYTIEEVPLQDPYAIEEHRVRYLLEEMKRVGERGEYTLYAADVKLFHTWMQGTIDQLKSCLCIIEQVSRDTFGKRMTPKEYADRCGYDS